MINKYTTALGACALLFFSACERPDSPDFSLEHKAQVPITTEATYQFLGGGGALIDTTKENFSSLFTTDQAGADKGLVTLSKQESFEFGNLDDALPEVDVVPAGIHAVVGEIALGSFTSGNGTVADVSFEDVTGVSSSGIQDGDPVPDQTNRQISNISFTTDHFVSATIKSGSLEIAVENQLGFDIDSFDIEVFSQGSSLGMVNFPDGPRLDYVEGAETIKTGELPVDGEQLENLEFTLTVSWADKDMETDSPGPFIVDEVAGKNLIASEVTAVLDPLEFSSSGTSIVDNSSFSFTSPDHYIELKSGELRFSDVVNEIDLNIDNLQISFPDIRTAPYTPADSLIISLQIPRNSVDATDETVELSDARIYAEGDKVDYNILATTEDMKATGSSARTIKETDKVAATVELNNLEVGKAHGIIAPRTVLLNSDDASNGTGRLDLFNDSEAEVIQIDALKNVSSKAGKVDFLDPVLNVLYDSNLDVEATIYAAIAGISADGNPEYLTGKSGEYSVSSSFSELRANGQPIPSSKLIKFNLDRPASGESVVKGAEIFDKENTNADVFLNNLPAKIRFIGLARLNESSGEGTVIDPVRFEPGFGMDVPLHLSSEQISFADTSQADLSDLPGGEDSGQSLSEAKVTIGYTNNLPFEMELSLRMLDRQYRPVTKVPDANEKPITLNGASVDPSSKFVTSGEEGKLTLSLNKQQLKLLNKTRYMVIDVAFNTTDNGEVKVRAEDSISISVKMSVALQSNVN